MLHQDQGPDPHFVFGIPYKLQCPLFQRFDGFDLNQKARAKIYQQLILNSY